MVVTRREFDEMVERCLARIPARFRRRMENVALLVEDEPPTPGLLGLYHGRPLPSRSAGESFAMPDRITIFQRPIEEDCDDADEIRAVIGETLIHEVGHYFGLSEEEIEEIEERYWSGEADADEDED